MTLGALYHLLLMMVFRQGHHLLHRDLGHLRVRELPVQLVRAAVHQLHQREASQVLQPLRLRAGARDGQLNTSEILSVQLFHLGTFVRL